MKKRITALLLCLVMVFSLIPTTVWAASNSTVVLHPSVNNTVTGVKVKVNDMIDGYSITKISGYDITVDLGKYNVNNGTFRLPYAKDIWEGVDNNKVDYISWAGSGSNQRSEGGSALLANGKNTAYYYFKGAPVLLTFTLTMTPTAATAHRPARPTRRPLSMRSPIPSPFPRRRRLVRAITSWVGTPTRMLLRPASSPATRSL